MAFDGAFYEDLIWGALAQSTVEGCSSALFVEAVYGDFYGAFFEDLLWPGAFYGDCFWGPSLRVQITEGCSWGPFMKGPQSWGFAD